MTEVKPVATAPFSMHAISLTAYAKRRVHWLLARVGLAAGLCALIFAVIGCGKGEPKDAAKEEKETEKVAPMPKEWDEIITSLYELANRRLAYDAKIRLSRSDQELADSYGNSGEFSKARRLLSESEQLLSEAKSIVAEEDAIILALSKKGFDLDRFAARFYPGDTLRNYDKSEVDWKKVFEACYRPR